MGSVLTDTVVEMQVPLAISLTSIPADSAHHGCADLHRLAFTYGRVLCACLRWQVIRAAYSWPAPAFDVLWTVLTQG
jgi:hypothetical protein